MKQTFILLVFILIAFYSGYSQKAAKAAAGAPVTSSQVLELKEKDFDFGKIPQGRPVTHDFEVVNKGKNPLSLANVQASCGCTTPEWTQEPIAAGAASNIKVGFNAAAAGHFTKTITITYDTDQTNIITISGEVFATPTTSAPVNASLSLIK